MKTFKALIPEIVADTVSREHAESLMQIFTTLMNKNKRFASWITDTNKGRDTLYAFMNHWLEGFKRTGRWIDHEYAQKEKVS